MLALGTTLAVYLLLQLLDVPRIEEAWQSAGNITLKVIPVLLLVVLLMALVNRIPNSFFKKHMGSESKIKGMLFAVLAGTFSHGPIYVWYPFLADLKEKGVSNGKIATFLFARAVKIPLLGAMVFYFGPAFTILFTSTILIGSLLLGFLFERV